MKNNSAISEYARQAFGRRVVAAILDVLIWTVLFMVTAICFGGITTVSNYMGSYIYISLNGTLSNIFFLIMFTCYVLTEWKFGGTIGKLAMGVRVVNAGGGRISLKQSVIRNLMRMVDAFPYVIPYVVGLIVVAGDESKRRLGDKVAKTVVVDRPV